MKNLFVLAMALFVVGAASAQTIFVSSGTPTCISATACPINIAISETPLTGSVKLILKFLPDSSSSYYADKGTITYNLSVSQAGRSYALTINPGYIGKVTASSTPMFLYSTANINGATNFYDSTKALRKGKYEVTASYQRTSNSAIVTSVSVFKWNLQNITLPPKIITPSTGTVAKDSFLFKDKLYDTTVMASSKKLVIYKNADRSLQSSLTLSDNLTDSFTLNLNHIVADSSNILSVSGQDSLPADTYKLVLSYQDGLAHAAASDSIILTVKSSTALPVINTPNNTVFSSLNPTGPISYRLTDYAASASIRFKSLADNSIFTAPLPVTSQTNLLYSLPANAPISNGKYLVTVAYQDSLGNTATSITDTVAFQKSTPLPVIKYPLNWVKQTLPIIIKDSIPGSVLHGSKLLTITGTSNAGVPVSITFNLGDAQTDSIYYDGITDPSSANGPVQSISGGPALPDGNYVLNLSYQDQYGNAVVSGSPVHFSLKTATAAPLLLSPVSYTGYGNLLTVNYSLPDAPALAGSAVLIFSNGTQTDTLFLNPQNITGPQSFAWLTNTDPAIIGGSPVASSKPVLPNGITNGVYTVSLSYRDNLGNAAQSATSSQVTINNQAADAHLL